MQHVNGRAKSLDEWRQPLGRKHLEVDIQETQSRRPQPPAPPDLQLVRPTPSMRKRYLKYRGGDSAREGIAELRHGIR